MVFPFMSCRAATLSAAATAAPDEMPPGIPSWRASGLESFLVRHRDHLVDDGAVENFRHEPGADALNFVRTGRSAREHGAVLGLDRDHADRRLAGLEHLPDAGRGTAGPNPRHDHVDRAPLVSFQISS